MPALIGGAPSSGSSLLANILNRHSKIYCGPETHLFTKSVLYSDWKSARRRLLSKSWRGLRSPGIHRYNGIDLEMTAADIKELNQSDSLVEFANKYFSKFNKLDWVEKTPANGYCFDSFLEGGADHKVIRIVRNPYDTVASLWKRNIPLDKAAALYICNNLININLKDDDRYLTVKYEDLVAKPKAEVSKIIGFLGYRFEEQMLDAEDETVMMEGWLQNEKGAISKSSVGRFSRFGDEDQAAIIELLKRMKLKAEFMDPYNTSIDCIEALCKLYDYEYLRGSPKMKATYPNSWSDRMISTIKLYPTHIFKYPVTIE